jgi:ribosome-associated heat shock protein Hsp15
LGAPAFGSIVLDFLILPEQPQRRAKLRDDYSSVPYLQTMTGVRMDKWLWAARFFKTRSMAAHACELGRIESHGQPAKPAREVKPGDLLRIKNETGDFEVEVLALSEVRGPAAVAQALYRETAESREARLKLAEERKLMPAFETRPARHRPVASWIEGPALTSAARSAHFRSKGC